MKGTRQVAAPPTQARVENQKPTQRTLYPYDEPDLKPWSPGGSCWNTQETLKDAKKAVQNLEEHARTEHTRLQEAFGKVSAGLDENKRATEEVVAVLEEVRTRLEENKRATEDVQARLEQNERATKEVVAGLKEVQAGLEENERATKEVVAGLKEVQAGLEESKIATDKRLSTVETKVVSLQEDVASLGNAIEKLTVLVSKGFESLMGMMETDDITTLAKRVGKEILTQLVAANA